MLAARSGFKHSPADALQTSPWLNILSALAPPCPTPASAAAAAAVHRCDPGRAGGGQNAVRFELAAAAVDASGCGQRHDTPGACAEPGMGDVDCVQAINKYPYPGILGKQQGICCSLRGSRYVLFFIHTP